jgi:anti-sigma regulatory factor (Ser/Thr protein kinase)
MSSAPAPVDTFEHPALFYRGAEDYLAGTVPFVRAGLASGEPVAVAVPGPNLAAIRANLGAAADGVRFLDMTRVGRNPGRIIPGVLRAFADSHPDQRVRIIGEPIWPGRTLTEYPACVQHEALINLAFAGLAATILCPYDAEGLDPTVLADAAATHPTLIDRSGPRASTRYRPEALVDAYNRPLPPPPAHAAQQHFDADGLPEVRRFTVDQGSRLGLTPRRVDDLELVADELAANAILHGDGTGTVRIWTGDDHVVCEVAGAGRIVDPLAGRIPVTLEQEAGRGLLLVNYLADLVRVYTADTGTTVRTYMALT